MLGEAGTEKARYVPGHRLLAWAGDVWGARRAKREGAGVSRAHAQRKFSASRLIVLLALIAMGATIISAGVGYGLAQQSDERLWSEQRSALRNAISEFRSLFGQTNAVDPRFVRMVEQSARLEGLKFEIEPAPSEREMQPVLDGSGRIAGFFTWEKTRPMQTAMDRLMPFIVGAAISLVGFAGFSLWQLRRARRELVASEAQAQRAADEDKLTGLPNHAKTLELLDLFLAEHAANESTTFALIELDGMEDVTAHLGVLGGDELIVAVADRVREAVPAGAVCGRVGSDEFAVMLTARDDVDIEAMLRAVLDNIARPHWFETVVRVSAHASFAQAPRHATTRGELTRRAELALRAADKRRPWRHRRLRDGDRHRLHRSEVHSPRIAAGAQRQRTGIALPADHRRAWRPHRRRRGAVALDPSNTWFNRSGGVHSGRRADGADGHARALSCCAGRSTRPSAGPTSISPSICRRCRCATGPSSIWCVRRLRKAVLRRRG